ncbi:hypothetical protein [Streptosporangium sp. NPDC049078]|uniref:hypothetical protein n=1 Tax=Streptosporangium sp. NPDC049078 TaxID=3155767 RepID=UPI00342EAAC6
MLLGALVVLALLGGLVKLLDGDGEPVAAEPSASAAPSQTTNAVPQLTADVIVEKLGDLYPLPNAQDNTGTCSGEPGDTRGCVKLITTDTVSVYEFRNTAVAKRWVTRFRSDGHDWRQADRFALAWSARDQALTSKEARSEMTDALRKWAVEK